MSTPKPTPKPTPKKFKATPNGNPFGLTAREVEIAILAWKCLEADGKASSESHPSTPPPPSKSHTDTNTYEHIPSMEDGEHHHDAPRKRNKVTDSSLAPPPKQMNKQNLAKLARFDKPETADRQWRKVKAKINEATLPSGSDAGGPDAPAAPATPGDGSTAAVAAADPGSPSLLASKKKKAAGGGKVAGRKRTMKEAGGDDDDDDAGVKKEAEGGERPKKGVKRVKATSAAALKEEEPNDGAVRLEAGEV